MTNTAVSGTFPQLLYAINQDLMTDLNLISQFLIGPSNATQAEFCFTASDLLLNCATEPCNGNRCHTYFNAFCRFTNRSLASTNCSLPRETVDYFSTYKLQLHFAFLR